MNEAAVAEATSQETETVKNQEQTAEQPQATTFEDAINHLADADDRRAQEVYLQFTDLSEVQDSTKKRAIIKDIWKNLVSLNQVISNKDIFILQDKLEEIEETLPELTQPDNEVPTTEEDSEADSADSAQSETEEAVAEDTNSAEDESQEETDQTDAAEDQDISESAQSEEDNTAKSDGENKEEETDESAETITATVTIGERAFSNHQELATELKKIRGIDTLGDRWSLAIFEVQQEDPREYTSAADFLWVSGIGEITANKIADHFGSLPKIEVKPRASRKEAAQPQEETEAETPVLRDTEGQQPEKSLNLPAIKDYRNYLLELRDAAKEADDNQKLQDINEQLDLLEKNPHRALTLATESATESESISADFFESVLASQGKTNRKGLLNRISNFFSRGKNKTTEANRSTTTAEEVTEQRDTLEISDKEIAQYKKELRQRYDQLIDDGDKAAADKITEILILLKTEPAQAITEAKKVLEKEETEEIDLSKAEQKKVLDRVKEKISGSNLSDRQKEWLIRGLSAAGGVALAAGLQHGMDVSSLQILLAGSITGAAIETPGLTLKLREMSSRWKEQNGLKRLFNSAAFKAMDFLAIAKEKKNRYLRPAIIGFMAEGAITGISNYLEANASGSQNEVVDSGQVTPTREVPVGPADGGNESSSATSQQGEIPTREVPAGPADKADSSESAWSTYETPTRESATGPADMVNESSDASAKPGETPSREVPTGPADQANSSEDSWSSYETPAREAVTGPADTDSQPTEAKKSFWKRWAPWLDPSAEAAAPTSTPQVGESEAVTAPAQDLEEQRWNDTPTNISETSSTPTAPQAESPWSDNNLKDFVAESDEAASAPTSQPEVDELERGSIWSNIADVLETNNNDKRIDPIKDVIRGINKQALGTEPVYTDMQPGDKAAVLENVMDYQNQQLPEGMVAWTLPEDMIEQMAEIVELTLNEPDRVREDVRTIIKDLYDGKLLAENMTKEQLDTVLSYISAQ